MAIIVIHQIKRSTGYIYGEKSTMPRQAGVSKNITADRGTLATM